jgi:hypothetical protein
MNSNYFILNRQLLKVIRIVSVALLLSLGMQSTAFAMLASIEQVKEVKNSFQETFPFHLPREDNRSSLLTQLRFPGTKIIVPPPFILQPRPIPSYPSLQPETIPEDNSYPSLQPETIPEDNSLWESQNSYSTIEEFLQPISQRIDTLRAEGKNLSRAEVGRLLALQLINWKAEGKNLSRADEERLIGLINQLIEDSNPSDSKAATTTSPIVTPPIRPPIRRVSPPERY